MNMFKQLNVLLGQIMTVVSVYSAIKIKRTFVRKTGVKSQIGALDPKDQYPIRTNFAVKFR